MTSAKSFQNNFGYAYRTGLRNCAWIAVINALVLFMNFCLGPIETFTTTTRVNHETGEVGRVNYKELYSFLFSDDMEFSRYLVIAALLGVGVFMGVAAFRFITGKKTVNVYYSLGIKRARLFSAKYLAGLTLIGLSVTVPMLVSLIANIVALGVNRYMMYAFFYLLFGMFSLAAFSFTLTAAVFATVGTMVEGVIFSGILLLLPEMLFYCLQVFIQKLVFGTPLGASFAQQPNFYYGGLVGVLDGNKTESLAKTFSAVNPLRYFAKGLYTYSNAAPAGKLTDYEDSTTLLSWHTPDFLTVLIWLFVTVAVFALGLYFFERRKAEIGGFIGKNKVLNFVTSFLIGTFGFAFLFQALQSTGKSMALSMTIGTVAFLVLCALFNLIMLRNLREFVKDLRGLPIQAALLALILVFFATGYFGTANKMPETAEIATARISTPYRSFRSEMAGTDYGYHYFMALGMPESRLLGEYTSEQDIKAVQNIHKMLLEAGRATPTALNGNFNGTYAYTVKIEYTLKNGKQVRRCYNGVSAEIMNALQQMDKTDCQKALLDKIFKDELKKPETKNNDTGFYRESPQQQTYRYILAVRESEDIRLYNKTLSTEIKMDLTAEQRQTLRDCLYKDLLAQEPEDLYNPKNPLGILSFMPVAEEIDDHPYGDTVQITEGVTMVDDGDVVYDEYGNVISGETAFTGKDTEDYDPDFFLTPDMVNTVAFLKSVGYYDMLLNEKPIKGAYGMTVSDMFTESYYDDFANSGELFPCEFLAESGMNNILNEFRWQYKNLEKVTDEKLLAQLHKNAVTRGEVVPTDYLVVFEYADGMYATILVHGADMPEGAKTAFAKNQRAQ